MTRTRGPRQGVFARLLVALVAIAVVERFAQVPLEHWQDLRIWAVQLGGAVVLAIALGGTARLARGLAVGMRIPCPSPLDIGLGALAVLLVLLYLGPKIDSLFQEHAPVLAGARGALVLAVAAAAAWGAARWTLDRLGASPLDDLLPAAALLCVPVGVGAALALSPVPAPLAGRLPGVAAGAAVFTAGVLVLSRLRRRRSLALVAWIALGVFALRATTMNVHDRAVVGPPPPKPASGPPVVMVVLDTFRADALDLSPPERSATPHLARLAAEADVYRHAIANASWTLPGHASLFTGRFLSGHRTDVTYEAGFSAALPPHLPTLQERFAAAGWDTACITANGIVSFRTGLARGCRRYRNPGRAWTRALLPIRLVNLFAADPSLMSQAWLEVTGININASGSEITDAALRELDASVGPPFLFLNFLDVHGPLPFPAEAPRPSPEARRAYRYAIARGLLGRESEDEIWRTHAMTLRACYDAQVRILDRELGRLFDELDRRGLWDRALVVVTADHGEGFVENPALPGYFGHHSAYEPSVRIPLLVKRPGQKRGVVHDELVQQADLLPTLLALAGLPPADGVDGRNLAGGTPLEGTVVTEWYVRAGEIAFPFVSHDRAALYDGPYKYVREGDGSEHLYDLDASPWEEVDVIADEPRRADALRTRLEAVRRHDGVGSTPAVVDAHLREQLEALGYAR